MQIDLIFAFFIFYISFSENFENEYEKSQCNNVTLPINDSRDNGLLANPDIFVHVYFRAKRGFIFLIFMIIFLDTKASLVE